MTPLPPRKLISFAASLALHALVLAHIIADRQTKKVEQPFIVEFDGYRSLIAPRGRAPSKAPAGRSRPTTMPGLSNTDGEVESATVGPPSTSEESELGYADFLDYPVQASLLPFFLAVHDRIDAHLTLNWNILRDEDQAACTLVIEVGSDGAFQRFISAQAENLTLKSWVQKEVLESLAQPLHIHASHGEKIVLALFFFFERGHSELTSENPYAPIVRNRLSFYRYKSKPFLVEAHESPEVGGRVLDLHLEEVYRLIFGKKTADPQRIEWDLNLKESEASAACDRGAEGGCLIAGKILESFGEKERAAEYYEKGCGLNYVDACREQSRLKGSRLKGNALPTSTTEA